MRISGVRVGFDGVKGCGAHVVWLGGYRCCGFGGVCNALIQGGDEEVFRDEADRYFGRA